MKENTFVYLLENFLGFARTQATVLYLKHQQFELFILWRS